MKRRRASRLFVVLLAGASLQGCAVPTHTITKRFAADLSRVWCVTADLYLVRNSSGGWWTGRPRLFAMPVEADAIAIRKPDVRATIPKGSRFRVVKVINRTSSTYGPLAYDHMLVPFIVFEAPFERMGTVDAGVLAIDAQDTTQSSLRFRAAAPCQNGESRIPNPYL